MNNDTLINEFRAKGYGYKRIASELSLTRDQVRYICRRHEKNPIDGNCKTCGMKLKSIQGKKRKVYCSDKCRYQWWNNQKKVYKKNESI